MECASHCRVKSASAAPKSGGSGRLFSQYKQLKLPIDYAGPMMTLRNAASRDAASDFE